MTRNDCPECQGTGWKPVEADGVRRVARCTCRETERAEQLLAQARIPRRYEDCEFDTFDGSGNPSLELAKLCAQRFVKEYPKGETERQSGLLFVGPTGVG